MQVTIVAAVNIDNKGIGYRGRIPWVLPGDMKHFSNITSTTSSKDKTNVVIMGRGTWESLPKHPLPNRLNIVLTSTHMSLAGAIVCTTYQGALDFVKREAKCIENVFVIGGERVYNVAIEHPLTTNIYITRVFPKTDTKCDTFFPLEKLSLFEEIEKSPMYTEGSICYDFCVYRKKE